MVIRAWLSIQGLQVVESEPTCSQHQEKQFAFVLRFFIDADWGPSRQVSPDRDFQLLAGGYCRYVELPALIL
jgi:hypothetical protein